MAMFDLPVMTYMERKVATRFRNDLLDHGFLMIQFSVYARPCVNFEQLDKHIGHHSKAGSGSGQCADAVTHG